MLSVKNVTKKYGKTVANSDISLCVTPGELTVLLGPNGAGKSTIIKAICGLLRCEGEISVFGHDNRSLEAKRILGYVPEFPALYPMLTVGEHLQFIAKAYQLEAWEARAAVLLTQFELEDKRQKLGKELSKGMQQKLSVCCALLPEPKAVIFDEPMVGLDPQGIRTLKNAMQALRDSGCALLVSTHMIDSFEELWDTTCIMQKGKIAATVRRGGLAEGQSLEEIYFSIIGDGEKQ